MANIPHPDDQNSLAKSSLARRIRVWHELSTRPFFRLLLFSLAASLWFLIVIVKLWDLQVRQADRLEEKAHRQHETAIETRAARGVIYDHLGEELALSTPVESIGVIPSKVRNPQLTTSLLAEVLNINPKIISRKLGKKKFQWIKRLAEPGETERVRHLKLPGIHFEKESKRYYPKGSVASHVLGAVGVDHEGLAGLEQQFEAILRGKNGLRIVQHDALQNRYSGYTVTPPTPGADLVLTIDQRIQMTAEKQLARAIAETHSSAGTIIVMDPNSGDLLALANWPTFDPNRPVSDRADLESRRNFAVTNLIEPGSTFKMVTVAAALEENLTRPTEVLNCELGGIRLGSRLIRDHKRFDHLTVSEVFAYSSNVGAIKLGLRLEPRRLYDYARRFGFGRRTGIPLPGEIQGILRHPDDWHPAAIGSVSIGQEVGATALQIARAASAIANGGLLVQPRIVEAKVASDGSREHVEAPPPIRILRPETAATMRAIMEFTVRHGGGKLAQTAGYRVGGKTGTAQKVDPETGAYSQTDYVPSFVGFAPVNNPAILVTIILDSPAGKYYGGQVAAPVFPRVATPALRFLDIPADLPLLPENPPRPPLLAATAGASLDDFRQEVSRPELPLAPAGFEAQANGGFVVTAVRRIGGPPDAARAGDPSAAPRPPVKLRLAERTLPDFQGQTVRAVAAHAMALGLRLEMRGAGKAFRQSPLPATPVSRGDLLIVEFGHTFEGAPGGP